MYDQGLGYNSRRAKEHKKRLIKFWAIMVIVCLISYKIGYDSVRSREAAYKEQTLELQKDRGRMEEKITSLNSKLQLYKIRYQKLAIKYKDNVPAGDLEHINNLIKKQLDAGMKPERIYSIISSTQPPQNCSRPIVKRFVMATPKYKGPKSSISFANGAIRILGKGESAVNAEGKPEAWYNAGKEIEITFKKINAKPVTKKGLLPIYNSIIVGNKEHRFTIAAGERSFINVTADSCDYR